MLTFFAFNFFFGLVLFPMFIYVSWRNGEIYDDISRLEIVMAFIVCIYPVVNILVLAYNVRGFFKIFSKPDTEGDSHDL